MTVDIKKARNEFKKYTNNYSKLNPKVTLKIKHTKRVATNAKKIAKYLKLSEEEQNLAELIGILHDIGRFEQIKKYNTFLDNESINHAEYGVEILFKEGLIRNFIEDKKYDKIIKIAISNHNRKPEDINQKLTSKELLYTKIIRDADKLDILYLLTKEKLTVLFGEHYKNDTITDKVYEDFVNNKLVNYKNTKTGLDIAVASLAYIYDINFKVSLKIISKCNYLNKIHNRLKINNKDSKEKLNTINTLANKYINKKILAP